MIDFKINEARCIKCGACVTDCPYRVISMPEGSIPFIKPEKEADCIGCEHCLAVCPTAALSILGVDPDTCLSPVGAATEVQMETLIRTRRSVRQFKKKDIDADRLNKLITTAANAPTGKNTRPVHLNIIDNMADMDKFREKVISLIEEMDKKGELTGQWSFFASIARAFRGGNDILFRGAPHLVVASAPADGVSPDADGFISLSYLELMAASMGFGTLWLGFLMYLFQLAPEIKDMLKIPDGNSVAYALLLGEPSVKYHRGVIRDEISVARVSFDD